MSKVLTFGIAAAVLAFTGATAVAQSTVGGTSTGSTQSGPQDGKKREARAGFQAILKQLDLTKDQKAKVKEIARNTRKEVQKLREEKPDRKTMRTRLAEIRTKQRDAIVAIMTSEQKAKYDKLLAELKEKQKEKKRDRKGS